MTLKKLFGTVHVPQATQCTLTEGLVVLNFWYVKFLILNLLRLQDACTAYDRKTETKEERKRTRTTKPYTSNRLKLVEEVTPQILFLNTKPFVISTDELLQVNAYF